MAKCLNKDPLKRATVDELLNDPFINGVDAKKYKQYVPIADRIRKMCTMTDCLSSTTLKSSISMILASTTANEIKKEIKKRFDAIISRSGIITRDGLIQLFINVGYSHSLVV